MEKLTINVTITSKYPEIVQEVRSNMCQGQDIETAVNNAFTDYLYKFQSDEDIVCLASWFNGSFSKAA